MPCSKPLALDPQRRSTSLNGKWHIIVDPYENGYYDYRYQPLVDEGYFRNQKAASPADRIEYDFDTSPELVVPGDWNSQRDELLFYEGTVWYKRDVEAQPAAGRRRFLHFGAGNYATKVWFNGHFVGEHVGGFTPFCFEVTEEVRANDNFVVVKCDNQRCKDGVPTVNTDWWNYGGLTRDVYWVDVPATFIREWHLSLDPENHERLLGWVQLDGAQAEQRVTLAIPELGFVTDTFSDSSGRAKFAVELSLQLWTPETPRLYAVEFTAETDRVTDAVGFRNVRVVGDEIWLNGQPVFLRGISMHEEAPCRPGRANGYEDARQLFTWAKELGCNFVRLAHYPHNEWMVRAADELGMLLWCEIPVYWTISWSNVETYALAVRQLTEMITRDRNRASIIIWSVGNETPLSDERHSFMRGLIATARQLDPTRLVSAALERHYADPYTQVIDDPLGRELDVIGCNEYIGWYDGPPEKADSISWQVLYEKPVIVSEFGADARQGRHGDCHERWTEEYQALVYERQIAMLQRLPHCRGMTLWILTDFRSPRRPLAGILDYYNRKGLISDQGTKKRAFEVLRQYYQGLAIAYESD